MKTLKNQKLKIPKEVLGIIEKLENEGFEAYIVGGCVRDLLLKRKPKDWDITTDALPEQIISLFEETFYENNYGTVGVVNKNVKDKSLEIIEITPFRLETSYSDNRRPDSVAFSKKIEDDLKRRDFTINAIAYNPQKGTIDLHSGEKDLKEKIIRTVGKPKERFREDGLRILRAIRLHAELSFTLNTDTETAIKITANSKSKTRNGIPRKVTH